ncbi:YfiM family protein [bacterium]|nr:YfiM family protein [bacterium]
MINSNIRYLLIIFSLFALYFSQNAALEKVQLDIADTSYLSINEFTYANHRLYTFSGKTPHRYSQFSKKKIIGYSISLVGLQYFLIKSSIGDDAWWESNGNFHFDHDEYYLKEMDKLGHGYVGYTLSKLNTDILLSNGASWDQAVFYGGLVSFVQSALIEYEDGFAINYGFSVNDLYSNCIGILFYYLQHYVPFFQNFTPKYYYAYNRIISDTRKYRGALIDNYEHIRLFMSINLYNMLSPDYNKMWIKGLDLVVGYSLKGFDKINGNYPLQEYYYIGIDLNLLSLLPNNNSRLNWFAQTINSFKFPSPTFKISG